MDKSFIALTYYFINFFRIHKQFLIIIMILALLVLGSGAPGADGGGGGVH